MTSKMRVVFITFTVVAICAAVGFVVTKRFSGVAPKNVEQTLPSNPVSTPEGDADFKSAPSSSYSSTPPTLTYDGTRFPLSESSAASFQYITGAIADPRDSATLIISTFGDNGNNADVAYSQDGHTGHVVCTNRYFTYDTMSGDTVEFYSSVTDGAERPADEVGQFESGCEIQPIYGLLGSKLILRYERSGYGGICSWPYDNMRYFELTDLGAGTKLFEPPAAWQAEADQFHQDCMKL